MITRRRISCSVLIALSIACVMIVFALAAKSRGVRWWEFGYYEKPIWSPNGEKVLYLFSRRPSDHPTLTVVETSSAPFFSQAQELELPARRLSSPAWRSNDEVSVFSERISGFGTDLRAEPAMLYLYDTSSETWEAFEAPLPVASGMAWHPHGNYALVSLRNHSTISQGEMQGSIYKFAPDTGQFELWFEAEWPGSIAWSPDGSYVAFLDFVPVGS